MKLLARLVALGAVALSQSAWADTGPYYVSYPGYCNVKKIYINVFSDLYGTEVGCSSSLGTPLIGSFTVDGKVAVSTVVNGSPCIAVYGTDGSLGGGCSAGGPISYTPRSTFTVRQDVGSSPPKPQFVVSTEMPDLEKTKDLPPRPE
jgi:hypothetical protein